jgi:phosphatidylglycerol:prolipoprotein diacylglycerol transferase
VPTTQDVHPTPVYESLLMGLVTLALWRARDSFRPGTIFALYLLIAGVERFLIELIRRNDPVLLGLTVAQLFSLLALAAGAALLAFRSRAPRAAST